MDSVIDLLIKVGAILPNDHFVGTSGRHLEAYINKDALFPHTAETSEIGKLFAEKFKDRDIDVVAGPAMGAAILSQWAAYHLSALNNKEIQAVYTEKDKGTTASGAESEQIFRRGYDTIVAGKNVLIIEDLTTTGGSLKKVIDSAKACGARVVACSVMVNRDPQNVNESVFGVPFMPLAEYATPSYAAEDCPMCKNNVPVNVTVGHGKKFVESLLK